MLNSFADNYSYYSTYTDEGNLNLPICTTGLTQVKKMVRLMKSWRTYLHCP
jgi:hypothetical protein